MDISEYLPMFLAEAREHLQELNLAVVRIEETPDDRETVDEIFRIAHSMKGMSATMGFGAMAALTHQMEDVFELLRQRRGGLDREAIDVLLASLDAMEANDAVRNSLLDRAKEGTPVYAECGGLMYLCRRVKGMDGRSREMTGVFDAEVEMTSRLQALGYVEAECVADSILSPAGGRVRGHVFHYSRVASHGGERFAYRLSKPKGIVGPWDGMVKGSALASYLHLHFGSNLEFAKGLALSCLGERAWPWDE